MTVLKICLSLSVWFFMSECLLVGIRKLCEPDLRHHSRPLPYVLDVGFFWICLPVVGAFVLSFLVWASIP